jgi:hypothetical protein
VVFEAEAFLSKPIPHVTIGLLKTQNLVKLNISRIRQNGYNHKIIFEAFNFINKYKVFMFQGISNHAI